VVKYWLAVACAEHVRRGRTLGFAQVCHGRAAPLKRMSAGDGIVYYSPSQRMGDKDGFQSFTAIGTVRAREPYRVEMFAGFTPYRRDIDWFEAAEQPIRPLLDWLDFTQAKNWGYALRLGVIEIPAVDFEFLQHVMTQARVAA
jgi:hypothetical protein